MSDRALAETRAWVERAVIGLQLCPFAKAPQVKGQVRYVASEADFVGMRGFGASAPAKELFEHFGITPEAVAARARERVSRLQAA